jgi:hypothetical protein
MPRQAQRELFSANFVHIMTPTSSYEVHSEARGPHWVAWITRGGATKPERSVLIVGGSQAEAEASAKQWAESLG